ncbi:MAG TPA: patatin-like phospholipase family protein [Candidatus Saccharicenans sp.]|nr:patatin-like phospholipase family protein [Candidatus Saccharicenans sp.]HRD01803.1 patatin-like phospholipase family protein [Candidatus Saccharicenans sp.]
MNTKITQEKNQGSPPGKCSGERRGTARFRHCSPSGQWALVLMGGGARGLAHIGVLKALLENGLTPPIITGTSMGAIIGGLFSAGYLPAEIEAIAQELGSSQLARLRQSKLPIPDKLVDYFIFESYQKKLIKRFGHEKGDILEKSLRHFLGEVCLEDLSIRFGCNAVDLVSGREVCFTSGPLYRALRASAAYPLLIDPACFQRSFMVDGGLLNNVPINLARQLGAARVLVPDIHRLLPKMPAAKLKSNLAVIFRLIQIVLADSTDSRLPAADLLININPSVDTFDFTQTKRLVSLGQKVTQTKIRAIKNMISKAGQAEA